jgi:phenylpropionate dioxygenase-like ring-hydroxylating dioxygenase large terminal subunit
VFGLPFVVFRDQSGEARVLADTCVHRGGSLSKGLIKNGNAVCPYHGWEFGGDGKCSKVPSLGEVTKIPARAKVDAYPVQEKYGIVFAFLGDLPEAERPPAL